jgi:hypothetical protein
MKKPLWDYINKNFFSILTVFGGSVALLLSRIGVLPQDIIAPTTLALVLLLATSQLVDNARKLENIESALKHGFQETILSLGGVSVIHIAEPEKGQVYLAECVKNAKSRLDHVALSPPIPRNHSGSIELEQAIEKTLLLNLVRYRYICSFYDSARATRVKKHLSNSKISKYFVGYFETQPNSVPLPNYLIVDDSEVVAIFPYIYGEPEVWLSIKHPEIVKMFSKYTERLWVESKKLTMKDVQSEKFIEVMCKNAG